MIEQLLGQSDQQSVPFILEERLATARKMLMGDLSPIQRRQELIARRLGVENPGSHKGGEAEFSQELPSNVVVATDEPNEEQVDIAKQSANDFKRVILLDGGKVKANTQGGGKVVLREYQDEEFTIDRDLSSGTGNSESEEPASSEPSSTPSMSQAGTAKKRMKRDLV